MITKILFYFLISFPVSVIPLILFDHVNASNKVIDYQKNYYFDEISHAMLLEDSEGKILAENEASDQSGSDENEEEKPPAGCCKDKTSGSWKKNRLTQNQCIRKNKQTDGDDLLKSKGVYWWDNQCQ
jgi:hypothetical protein